MSENIAILSLMAKLKDNSREITKDLNSQINHVEKNADKIKVDIDNSEFSSDINKVTSEIMTLANGKLKKLDLTKYFESLVKSFADPTKSAADYLSELRQIHTELELISKAAKDAGGYDLFNNFNGRDITSAISAYKKIVDYQNNLKTAKSKISAQARSDDANMPEYSLQSLKTSYTRNNNDVYLKAQSAERISEIASHYNIKETKESKALIKSYSEVLALYELMIAKKKELQNFSTEDEAKEYVKIAKTLVDLNTKISGYEDRIISNYGVKPKDLLSKQLDKTYPNSITQATDKYANFMVKQMEEKLNMMMQKYAEDIQLKAIERTNQYAEKQNASILSATNKTSKKYGSINTSTESNLNNQFPENISHIIPEQTDEQIQDVTQEIQQLNQELSDTSEVDKFALAFDKIRDKFADVEKYAVSLDEALSKVKNLHTILNKREFSKDEEKDFVGYSQRVMSIGGKLPNDIEEDFYDYSDYGDYKKFTVRINQMTEAQLEAVNSIEAVAVSIADVSKNADIPSDQIEQGLKKIQHAAENTTEAIEQTVRAEQELAKLGLTKENLPDVIADNEAKIAYDDETGNYSLIDTIVDYYEYFKETNAYIQQGNDLLEERAILIKKGQQVGEEFVTSSTTGKVNLGKAVEKYQPDTILHTHPFSETVDNLRFSDADIKELVDGTVKKAILLCGDEIETLDMSNISSANFENLKNDILGAYTAVFARFGAEIQDDRLIGLTDFSSDIQNQATKLINQLMANIVRNYGGEIFFDKMDEGWPIENDIVRLPTIDPSELSIIQQFLEAVASPDPINNIKRLQKELGVLKNATLDIDDNSLERQAKKQKQLVEDLENTTKKMDGSVNLNDDITTETSDIQNLHNELTKVTSAINDKTNAFQEEGSIVSAVVTSELEELGMLRDYIKDIVTFVEKLQTAFQTISSLQGYDLYNGTQTEDLYKLSGLLDDIYYRLSDINSNSLNISLDIDNIKDLNNGTLKDLSDIHISDSIDDEFNNISILYLAIDELRNAVDAKTLAFQNEAQVVESSVSNEVLVLNKLKEALDEIKSKILEINNIDLDVKITRKPDETSSQKKSTTEDKDVSSKNGGTSKKVTKNNSIQDIPSTYISNINKAYDEATKVNNALDRTQVLMSDLSYSLANKGLSPVFERIGNSVKLLNNELTSGKITINQYDSQIDKLTDSLKNINSYAENAEEAMKFLEKRASQLGAITTKFTSLKNGNIKATSYLKDGQTLIQLWDNISGGISDTTNKTQKATNTLGTFFDGLKSKWGDVLKYALSFGSIYEVFEVVRQGATIIRDLDDALTEMQKVSDESFSSLQAFQKESFDLASGIGTTGAQIQQSTAAFMRLGESLDDAKESAQAANILFNVSEFDSIDSATESLIAMSAAYSDLDKMEINDKLNNIGNNFSISTDGIATALQKSASALTTAGNDIDEAIALITAGNAIIQDPDSVGAGLRTIALRITGTEAAKEELESIGEDVSDFVVQTSAKSQKSIKDFTKVASNNFEGFDILDDNGNFKSTYEIMLGISEIYEEIVETDKKYGSNMANGLLETLAGKNRANIAGSILQNPKILRQVYESSQNSEGSALEENQKYLESISGHVDKLKNKWQELWSNTAGRDTVNWILDIGTGLLDIVDKLGLIQTALGAITALYTAKNVFTGEGFLVDLLG